MNNKNALTSKEHLYMLLQTWLESENIVTIGDLNVHSNKTPIAHLLIFTS